MAMRSRPFATPCALSASDAAAFVGVSEPTFRRLVQQGIYPEARVILTRVLWSARELEAAFHTLPRRGEEALTDDEQDWSPG